MWGASRGDEAWVGQRFSWVVDGRSAPVEVVVQADRGAAGRVRRIVRYRTGEEPLVWEGDAVWLELSVLDGTLASGTWPTIDPADLQERTVTVGRAGSLWLWSADGVRTTASPEGSFAWGGMTAFPVPVEPDLEPVDPATLFRRPARLLDGVRGAHKGSWTVGEESVETSRPLDAEVPRATREQLSRWVRAVRRQLDHAPSPGSPDALRALARGAGDCNEFAAVLVSMAEADGFRARPVSGLVWMERDGHPSLELHAWAEVDLGESLGWVAVDPALDQPLADASHLPLARGRGIAAAVGVLSEGTKVELVSVR